MDAPHDREQREERRTQRLILQAVARQHALAKAINESVQQVAGSEDLRGFDYIDAIVEAGDRLERELS